MYLPYSKQYIDDDDVAAVVAALRAPLITQGAKVEAFEERVAAYCGARYGLAFSSGTAALHAAMYAVGIGPGDEVITTPLTFVASANAAVYMGAKPVFVDIDPLTYCIAADKIEAALTPRSRAIVAVDFAGYPVDISALKVLAAKYSLRLIEDAAHALGAWRGEQPVGAEADITMFSFHPVKHITTGEGGMLLTGDRNLYEKMKRFRSHGIVKGEDWHYEMLDIGYNYRITDIQCALGLSQFNKLESFLSARGQLAAYYDRLLAGYAWITRPPRVQTGRHAYHLYPVLLASEMDRRSVFRHLHRQGIGTQVHYIPVHTQPYYRQKFGYRWGDFPLAEDYYRRTLSLPLYPDLTETEQEYVVDALRGAEKER